MACSGHRESTILYCPLQSTLTTFVNLLGLTALGGGRAATFKSSSLRSLQLAKWLGEMPAFGGCHYQFRKTRLPTDLPESATLAYETQDSATNGPASPFSQLNWAGKVQKMNALHTFSGERATRKVVQRPTCLQESSKNHLKNEILLLRILTKNSA